MSKFVNIFAEQSVLGAIIQAGEDFADMAMDAIEGLSEEDFTSSGHRLILRACKRVHGAGVRLDLVSLSADLERAGEIDLAGGFGYLAECAKNTPLTRNLPTYVEELKQNALGRRVMVTLSEGMEKMLAPGVVPLSDVIGGIQTQIGNIESSRESGTKHIMAGVDLSLAAIEAQLNGEMWRYKTLLGLPVIDDAFGGFNNTDLIVIGGRPGTGKTMLSTTVTEAVSLKQKKPVMFFSLEMPIEQISERIAFHRARINKGQLLGHAGSSLMDEAWARCGEALKDIQNAPIHINDKTALSIHQLRAEARRMHKQLGGLGVIVVDYLQKMTMSNPENMNQSVGEIATGLKNLAKELRCPVIALSQLNRNLEQRANKRPVNSDLRESGVIEQEADVILMVYRDEKYNPQTELKGITEIICTKSRHAPGAEKSYYFSHAHSGLDPVDLTRINTEEHQHELEC